MSEDDRDTEEIPIVPDPSAPKRFAIPRGTYARLRNYTTTLREVQRLVELTITTAAEAQDQITTFEFVDIAEEDGQCFVIYRDRSLPTS